MSDKLDRFIERLEGFEEPDSSLVDTGDEKLITLISGMRMSIVLGIADIDAIEGAMVMCYVLGRERGRKDGAMRDLLSAPLGEEG